MKTLYTTLILFFFFCGAIKAQEQNIAGNISGTIKDQQQKSMDYVTVALFRQADSALVKTALTNEQGKFQFSQLKAGNYYLKANMMGYDMLRTKALTIDENHQQISLNNLQLVSQSKSLQEVSIVKAKPLLERKLDKTVMNVESSSIMTGSTALEVLQKAPGVSVDQNDKISMQGKQGVLIQIDGKQTYMSMTDVTNMLRSMPSSQIETIELITNPSAKYDASGNSGIINIKTKKQKNGGTNGSLNLGAGQGRYFRGNAGLNLNHRTEHFNVYGNYNYSSSKRFQETTINRISSSQGTDTYFAQTGNSINNNKNNNFKAGIDYFIDKKNTIGLLFTGYVNNGIQTFENKTNIGSSFVKPDSSLFSDNSFKNHYQNLAYNLNYKSILDTSGQEITVDLDYSKYKGDQDANYINRHLLPNGMELRPTTFMKNQSPSNIDVKAFKTDYTLPLSKTLKLEAGLKSSWVKTDNNFIYQDEFNGKGSNRFVYKEDVYAGYVNLGKTFKHTSVQVGLRAEQTRSEGNSVDKNKISKRTYLDFFPTIFINQTLSEKHSIGISYGRRIDRPEYDALNPFIFYLDQYTYNQGNEFLRPQYTDNYEMNYTFLQKYSLSLNYSYVKDAIIQAILPDNSKKSLYQTNINVKKNTSFSANLNIPVEIAKWWQTNNNLNVFHLNFQQPDLNGQDLNTGKTSFQFKSQHSFIIRKDLSAEMSASYESPLDYGTLSLKSRYGLDIGFSKSFMNKKVNLKMALSDVFNTQITKLSSAYPGLIYNLDQKNETRAARVTLTYRFGKNEIKPARRRSTGVEAEAGRMKN
ncbi:outer membrane beta-barrel family protein [Pedobacter nutrimenti]|jgi:hypothetical protein|uniref:Outer membrane receptor protein involved in Fe transport n=1 Tax=Pedobacter nutrimenti TaxID=1241337 RepID=A0A318UI24_9SPHI|nr:outer membrane beta-barrel family protein [Pedobacter nutrimenti]PYF75733.1 outer membrane receptor protein involved in Fe transport [Pedobacter nutrimenti]